MRSHSETPRTHGSDPDRGAETGPLSRYRVELLWSRDEEAFVATAPQFGRGACARGATPGETLRELESVLAALEDRCRKAGRRLPESPEYSGQLRVRMPKSLHAKLAGSAKLEGVSLNTLIVSYLSERAADESVFAQLREQFDDSASPEDYRAAGG